MRNRWESPEYRQAVWLANLRRLYGVTPEWFIAHSKDGCECCGRKFSKGKRGPRRLSVDHDHETSKPRGVLCDQCNRGIGFLGDNLDGVLRAVKYLRRTLK